MLFWTPYRLTTSFNISSSSPKLWCIYTNQYFVWYSEYRNKPLYIISIINCMYLYHYAYDKEYRYLSLTIITALILGFSIFPFDLVGKTHK